jgi:hypothetical protein
LSFKSFKPGQCRKALKNKGFEENKKKDHYYYYLIADGLVRGVFTKVSHTNKKSIGKPLFSQIAKDLGVSKEFLQDFLNCPKTREDLLNLLRAEGRISNE